MLPKNKKIWVNWKLEKTAKGDITKVPYQTNGRKASSTNPSTWATYEDVTRSAHNFNGIGIIFDGSLLGVDLDHVVENNIIIDPLSEKFVQQANSYTEISPSGTGLHVYFALSEPFSLTSNAHKPNPTIKYECYTEKRYFTVTENSFGPDKEVRSISGEEATELLSILGYPWAKTTEEDVPAVLTRGNNLSEESVLKIMFHAKNGEKMKALWDGDLTQYKDDASSADIALCNALAFYTGCNAPLIEKMWLSSPLGARRKTQTRKDYRHITIKKAINNTKEVFTADDSYDHVKEFITKKNSEGIETIVLCTQNIQIFLDTYKEFKGRFRFDTFKQCVEYRRLDEWEKLTDTEVILIQCRISEIHPAFWNVSKQMVHDAITANSRIHSFDSAADYFKSLVWDKKPRIETWLCEAYGVADNVYHRAVASNWLKGLAKRATHPGCKFDYVLVIEGDQGIKKSMSLEILGGDWHTSTFLTPDNKDFFLAFFGKLIVEFSEGETLSRSEVKKLKSMITMLHDDMRLPYAREVERFPRRCVFAMTTNETEYLKDDTGNRRWLPVAVVSKEINTDWIRANRDQLFAEAYYRAVILNENYWDFPKEETAEEQRKRQFISPLSEKIQEWYISLPQDFRDNGVTTQDVFSGLNPASTTLGPKMNQLDAIHIGKVLKSDLSLKTKEQMRGGIRSRVYVPTELTPTLIKTAFSDFEPTIQN